MNNSDTILLDRTVPVLHLDQWFGYWLMDAEKGQSLFAAITRMNIPSHVEMVTRASADNGGSSEQVGVKRGYGYELNDGIATVELVGTLMKQQSSASESTSTVMMRNTVRKMATDDRVKAVIMKIDSPGGTVAGAYELADDISALSSAKPTYASIENLGASAAYLMAAQMRSISAAPSALVGSIGTVGVVYDMSANAAMQGIKVHVIRGQIDGKSAPLKGAGTPGSEITADQLVRWQQNINDLNEQFLVAVENGRKMPRTKLNEIADGGVWSADRAKGLGLVDTVESYDQLFSRVRQQLNSKSPALAGRRAAHSASQGAGPLNVETLIDETTQTAQAAAPADVPLVASDEAGSTSGDTPEKGADMSQTKETAPSQTATEPKPATIAELKKAFPNDSAHALDCAEKALTLTEAKAAYADVLQTRNEALTAKNAELQTSATTQADGNKTPVKKAGTKPIESASSEAGILNTDSSATAELEKRVDVMCARNSTLERYTASAKVLSEDPELRGRYVAEQGDKRRDRITQRQKDLAALAESRK